MWQFHYGLHFCHAQLFNYLQCQNLWESKPWLSKHMLTLSFNSYWSSLPQNSLAGHLRFLVIMKLSAKWPEIITVTTCDDETNVPYAYTSVIQLSALFTHREKKKSLWVQWTLFPSLHFLQPKLLDASLFCTGLRQHCSLCNRVHS